MKIVIIGSGNVAAVLGRKFNAANFSIEQIVGRNASAASELAYELNTISTNYLSAINRSADVYIIAVTDMAIADVIKDLKLPDKVVAHTAASVPMDILKKVSRHYGVFYPLQTLRKESVSVPEIPIFYEGSDELAKKKLGVLAQSIAGQKVMEAGPDMLLKMHVGGVLVSNFTNHLYALAANYCRKEGLDFRQLQPLIIETANRIKEMEPEKAQTGPAVRHDKETIKKHLALLKEYPTLKKIYELMTDSIQESEK